ncbi:MAG: response regulator [Janthinobacterium lividum]
MPTAPLAYVIENDRITATVTELVLRKHLRRGEVRTYGNGRLALDGLGEALRSGHAVPDLILLDLDMPVMDGWEFLDALRSVPVAKHLCVFVLTSSIHPDDAGKAKRYPQVKGFFSKPLSSESVAWMQHFVHLAGASGRAQRLGATAPSRWHGAPAPAAAPDYGGTRLGTRPR